MEQNKLCFKVGEVEKSIRGIVRNKWYNILINNADKFGLKVKKPARFGNGNYMTVAVLDEEYRKTASDGKIELLETFEFIRKIENMLKSVVVETTDIQN